jgi:hypothetical protein
MDLDHDDYKEGSIFKEWQEIVLDTAHRIVVSANIYYVLVEGSDID